MNVTKRPPEVPLDKFKRNKIIATVGPTTNSYEMIFEMLKAGVNGYRLNFSHGNYNERKQQIKWIRKASEEYAKPVAIIADLQGPKIRLGDFEGRIELKKGQEISLKYGVEYKKDGPLPIQHDLAEKVKRGERLYIFDGRIKTHITTVKDKEIFLKVENDGYIMARKGINLPDTNFEGAVLTKKDKEDLAFISTQDVDYVAMSFVQGAKDIKDIKKIIDNHNLTTKVIAKIETAKAVDNLDAIVAESDAVMVARGDLAIETEPESVPVIQRQIIAKCIEYGKISIIATQMLASMTDSPEPTRAEVSDVATGIILGVDAVMLSDETANGKYPIESIKMMKRIVLYTQQNSPVEPLFYNERDHTIQSSITSAIITLAHQVQAKAIVAQTKSGSTALSVASHRPKMPIIMVTSDDKVAQQLSIVYGGKTFIRRATKTRSQKLTDWLRQQKVFNKGDIIVISQGKYPGKSGGTDTIKVRKLD